VRHRAEGSNSVWCGARSRAQIVCIVAASLTHIGGPRQQFRDIDGNAIAIHHHRTLGDGQIVREDANGVFLGGVQFDNGAAAEPEHLMDRHRCGAKHHGDIDGNFVECGHVCSLSRAKCGGGQT